MFRRVLGIFGVGWALLGCPAITAPTDGGPERDATSDIPLRFDAPILTDVGQTLSDISSASCDGPQDERGVCLRCSRGSRYPIEGAWDARLSSGTARFTFEGDRWYATSPSGERLAFGYYSVDDHTLVLNELFLDAAFVVAMCPTSPQGRYRIDHESDRCAELTLVATEDLCDARRTALNNARFTRIDGSP